MMKSAGRRLMRALRKGALLLCFMMAAGAAYCWDPTPQTLIDNEAAWIRSCQRSTGAICMSSDQLSIVPYFSHIAAIGLCKAGGTTNLNAAKDWMNWYINHFNWPDQWGYYGTVYDHFISGGQEVSSNDCDSVDSYSAFFLTLCKEYYLASGDTAWFTQTSRKYQLTVVANTIEALQQSDGLTWAKPNYLVKYLMDNCEVYRGFADFAYLLDVVYSDTSARDWYNGKAQSTLNGIASLWHTSYYAPMKYSSGLHASMSWSTWYPHVMAQNWPKLCNLPIDQNRLLLLYNNSCYNIDWENSADPECSTGYVASVWWAYETYAHQTNALTNYVQNNHLWPWTCAEAGFWIQKNVQIRDQW